MSGYEGSECCGKRDEGLLAHLQGGEGCACGRKDLQALAAWWRAVYIIDSCRKRTRPIVLNKMEALVEASASMCVGVELVAWQCARMHE